jgi:hypothetical protein
MRKKPVRYPLFSLCLHLDSYLVLKPTPQVDENSKETYTYEGNYSFSITKSSYARTMTKIYKELNIVQRQFRIQYHVPLKHQKYHRFAFKRIYYQLHGKTTILSVRSQDPSLNLEGTTKEYKKPWKQSSLELKSKSRTLLTQEEIIPENTAATITANTEAAPQHHSDGVTSTHVAHDGRENVSPEIVKRGLRPFFPANSVVTEIPLTAAPILLDLTTRIASHLGTLLKKQISQLILDFAKNSQDEYVLIEVHGFQFANYGPDIQQRNGSFGRALSLSHGLKHKIEHYYHCRLNGMRFQSHSNREDDPDYDSDDSSDGDASLHDDPQYEDHAGRPKISTEDLITPQTLTCRMCTRKIVPGSIRYLLTSVMLHSTVVHLRSRLPVEDLPEFCRDRSFTMKTMQRLDDISSFLCPNKLDATEADLVTCEQCYALYKGESKLMEVEHRMAKFTRTTGSNFAPLENRLRATRPTAEPLSPAEIQKKPTPVAPERKRASVFGTNLMDRPDSAPALVPSWNRSNLDSNKNKVSDTPKKVGLESAKETLLRDTFRAKNAPTRTTSKDFYETSSPLKRSTSIVSESKKNDKLVSIHGQEKLKHKSQHSGHEYPPVSSLPMGRRVARSDIMSQKFTLCRMMVAIHKVIALFFHLHLTRSLISQLHFLMHMNTSLCLISLSEGAVMLHVLKILPSQEIVSTGLRIEILCAQIQKWVACWMALKRMVKVRVLRVMEAVFVVILRVGSVKMIQMRREANPVSDKMMNLILNIRLHGKLLS